MANKHASKERKEALANTPMSVMQKDCARKNIQVGQIIKRLNDHMSGAVDMSPTQIKAAEILLRKALPDLSQISGAGEGGAHVVQMNMSVNFVSTKK